MSTKEKLAEEYAKTIGKPHVSPAIERDFIAGFDKAIELAVEIAHSKYVGTCYQQDKKESHFEYTDKVQMLVAKLAEGTGE